MSKDDNPQHLHLAYFGSELACSICNPVCYENHGVNKISWCGHPKCPIKPRIKPLRCKLGLHKDTIIDGECIDGGMYAIYPYYKCTFQCVLCSRTEKRWTGSEEYYWWLKHRRD